MYSQIVAMAFKLINFGIIISVSIYYFKTRLLRKIKDRIKEKEVFKENLHANKHQLIGQQHKLDEEIVWQREYAGQLFEKINRWNAQVKTSQDQQARKLETYIQDTEKKREQQAHHQAMFHMIQRVVPIAFDNVTKKLKATFEPDGPQAAQYIDGIIKNIKKSP